MTNEMTTKCPICANEMRRYGTVSFYLPGEPCVPTSLFDCPNCDLFYRVITDEQLASHLTITSYTQAKYEDQLYHQRKRFFAWLYSLIRKNSKSRLERVLDYGCAYGHFLQLLSEEGSSVIGVEPCDEPRDLCKTKGIEVVSTLDVIPDSELFDCITVIDSLYLVGDPVPLLKQFNKRLKSEGLLLIRVSNRNWYVRLLKKLFRYDSFGFRLGDVRIAHSRKSIKELLDRTGYTVVYSTFLEKGKTNHSLKILLSRLSLNLIVLV